MTRNKGQLKQWLLAIGVTALSWAGTGCSILIAHSGVSGLHETETLVTCTELRQQFGVPAASETREDGTIVETYHIRKKLSPVLTQDETLYLLTWPVSNLCYLGLPELFLTASALYKSEHEKLRLAFVCGADDRVLFRYDVNLSPEDARRKLAFSLMAQLESETCPSWLACVGPFVEEVRRRAGWVGYALTPEDEESLQQLVAIAKVVDDGKMTKQDGVTAVWLCSVGGPSCVPDRP